MGSIIPYGTFLLNERPYIPNVVLVHGLVTLGWILLAVLGWPALALAIALLSKKRRDQFRDDMRHGHPD
jgi:hypothetical protein